MDFSFIFVVNSFLFATKIKGKDGKIKQKKHRYKKS
jgi:hypothetical protein